MKKKYIYLNIKNNNLNIIIDKQINLNYIYYIFNNNKKIKYLYLLNNIYIFYINNNLYYLILNLYKYLFTLININYYYSIKLNILGINYKFYYLINYNSLIFQLKYNHKIILKLPIVILCKIDINKNIIYLYSYNLFLLNSIGKLINSLQYINKYKELGINIIK